MLVGGDVAGRVCLTAGIALFIDEDDCAYGSYEAGWWALGMRKWGFGFRWSGLFVDQRGREMSSPMSGRYPALGTLRTRSASEIFVRSLSVGR